VGQFYLAKKNPPEALCTGIVPAFCLDPEWYGRKSSQALISLFPIKNSIFKLQFLNYT
jgi:hypothetical protein